MLHTHLPILTLSILHMLGNKNTRLTYFHVLSQKVTNASGNTGAGKGFFVLVR